jgi:hypothetical protein
MKKVAILVINLFFALSCYAKDFHFVYVRIDDSMNIEMVKDQIRILKNEFQNEDFVLYYSNYQMSMNATNYSEKELFGLINEQMSSSAITLFDEINKIGELFDRYLNVEFDENERLISTKYSQIIFNCIVGDNFVEDKYQDEVFARSILINSLNDFNLQINFYPCGAKYFDVKFSNQYNINNINIRVI